MSEAMRQARLRAAEAAAEANDRTKLNRFDDPAVEAMAKHIRDKVDIRDRYGASHHAHTTGQTSAALLKRYAEQLNMSVDDTLEALGAVSAHLHLQLLKMLAAHGVDAQAFLKWMERDGHRDELIKADQIHALERDVVRAYSSHIAAFKASGGR
jgi:hypothetical protein